MHHTLFVIIYTIHETMGNLSKAADFPFVRNQRSFDGFEPKPHRSKVMRTQHRLSAPSGASGPAGFKATREVKRKLKQLYRKTGGTMIQEILFYILDVEICIALLVIRDFY